jgi:TPR repeat protein
MNDIEFAQKVSTHIGEIYREAKRSCRQFPKHALSQTRALASLCCDLLLSSDAPHGPRGLNDKIALLVRSDRIHPDTLELLHKLRRWGNAAAHPEVSLMSGQKLAALGDHGLATARNLLEIVFRDIQHGAPVPDYDVVPHDEADELKELTYRALIGNSAADQHQVAMYLMQTIEDKIAVVKAGSSAAPSLHADQLELNSLRTRAVDLLGYASEAGYAPAHYEFGLAMFNGMRGDDKVSMGVNRIARAARCGHADALAWSGQAALYGLYDYEVDYELAREYLEKAAADDHPMALTLLSRMHRCGLGVTTDAEIAFALTLRAAEAGYPIAQYETALALFQGDGAGQDEPAALQWLRRSSDAGYALAGRMVAILIRRGEAPGTPEEAAQLLMNAIPSCNIARLDLADMFVAGTDAERQIQAAYLVQECYELALKENDAVLAEQCRRQGPVVAAALGALGSGMPDHLLKELLMARFLFDLGGQPYPHRLDRARLFFESARVLSKAKSQDPRDAARRVGLPASGTGLPSSTSRQRLLPARSPMAERSMLQPSSLHPVRQRVIGAKVGRNNVCPCGSGLKYKQCCVDH